MTAGERVQPSRRVAFAVLEAVREDDAYANLILPRYIVEAELDAKDAAFATELAYGTLRRLGTYDRILAIVTARPVVDIDPAVLDVLRLGAHQLLGMRVASHAAVGESVELVREAGHPRAAGFVNGTLRTLSRRSAEEWMAQALEKLKGARRLAIEHAHPRWIVDALQAALDAEGRGEEIAALLEADNVSPRVALAALPGLSVPASLVEELGERAEAGGVSPVGVVLSGGDPGRIPEVRRGRARVQDEGSQLAALALSRAREVQPGERWLDMCAGPGGKAALLAAEAAEHGAVLMANEVAPTRAELVRKALAALDPAPEVLVGDGRRFGRELPGRFDRILLDAPCTGLGALRRRPEARWRKSPEDVAELAALQAELLDSAVAALRPGGLLAYVTCSPHLEETRGIVVAALERHAGLTALDTPAVLESVAVRPLGLGSGPAAQLWPHRHGTDAMFVQLLTTEP
ncbi:RsmB/NOP family class I SAM-dependent RNA methyltransferase [Homoserinibacter sp. YIM 151385]|uniref:RsmB/NOP family class I SAM-dependent RNA methyltransferase n=1 Tax=Homoserinibacter sp. YIM 151385 TaxID=2985506 RepID=UPI0022F064FF|nr:transcription antitermination factor NusB [Homoserinibacter sp. YIM 151385]WBU38646.1 rRNA small subunit methyltransferase B [Homoserinibacter sp. YIM 151385]